jgi:hypothetical protein
MILGSENILLTPNIRYFAVPIKMVMHIQTFLKNNLAQLKIINNSSLKSRAIINS